MKTKKHMIAVGENVAIVDKDGVKLGRLSATPVEGATHITFRHVSGPLYEITSETGPSGPAMVNSPEYCSGWDRIFGGKKEVGQA